MEKELLERKLKDWQFTVRAVGELVLDSYDVELIKNVLKDLEEDNLRLETELSMIR